jgi:hypothetical protein
LGEKKLAGKKVTFFGFSRITPPEAECQLFSSPTTEIRITPEKV